MKKNLFKYCLFLGVALMAFFGALASQKSSGLSEDNNTGVFFAHLEDMQQMADQGQISTVPLASHSENNPFDNFVEESEEEEDEVLTSYQFTKLHQAFTSIFSMLENWYFAVSDKEIIESEDPIHTLSTRLFVIFRVFRL